MPAYLNGKKVSFNYVFNDNVYTVTKSAQGTLRISLPEEKALSLLITITENGEPVSGVIVEVFEYPKAKTSQYTTDTNGEVIANVEGNDITINGYGKVVTAKYYYSIPVKFEEVDNKFEEADNKFEEVDNKLREHDNLFENNNRELQGYMWKQYNTNALYSYTIKETYEVHRWELWYDSTMGEYTDGEEFITYGDEQPPADNQGYWKHKSVETFTEEYAGIEHNIFYEVGTVNAPAIMPFYGGETEIIDRTTINAPSEKTFPTGQYVINSDYNHLPVDGFKEEDGFWYVRIDNLATENYVDNKVGDIETALDTIIAQQESIIEIQNALIGGDIE